MTNTRPEPSRTVLGTLTAVGAIIGIILAVAADDVIMGVIAGSAFVAVTAGALRLWYGGPDHDRRSPRHP